MKIALTLLNEESKPMMVVEFPKYQDLRKYWKRRRLSVSGFIAERMTDDEIHEARKRCVGLSPMIGEGYRRVGRDETIEYGDQWWATASSSWQDTHCAGGKPVASTVYRRRVLSADCGAGWRWLSDGDVLQKDDECRTVSGLWIPTNCAGMEVGPHNPHTYRRRTMYSPPPEGYVLLRPDDIMSDGDLFFNGREWKSVSINGHKVGGGEGYFARPINELIKDEQPVKLELITTNK